MFWSQAFALLALAALVQSAPLSRVDAESAKARMKKLMTFADGFHAHVAGKGLTDCKARSTTFASTCAKTSTCKDGDKDVANSLCCADGKKECKYDATGQKEISGGFTGVCCDHCLNQTILDYSPEYAAWCSAAGQKKMGATVCGTGAGTCNTCMAGSTVIGPGNSCEGKGLCKAGSVDKGVMHGSGACNGECMETKGTGDTQTTEPTSSFKSKDTCKDGTDMVDGTKITRIWNAAKFTAGTVTTLTGTEHDTQAKCEASSKCFKCEGCVGCPGEKTSCLKNGLCSKKPEFHKGKASCEGDGGVWTSAKWAEQVGKTKDTCATGGSPATWEEKASFKEGEKLKAQGATSCMIGPTHSEPMHILDKNNCLDQASFLADAAAGKTVAAAMSAKAAYYANAAKNVLGGASLVNHKNATSRAAMTLTNETCFVVIGQAKNHGKFTISGSSKTYALIIEPTNFADADDLKVTGGSATVLGGSNAGNIVSTTTGSFEVYGLSNRGNVHVSGATNVIIADVQNKGGKILVTDMPSVTLINVQSYGNITANGANGNYKAYDIVNTGLITINAGTIDLHFKCNTGGTVTVGTSVTGKISYENGCKGIITAPTAVTLTELGASATPAKKVSGSIKFKVPTANAAAFKTEPKVKKAIQSAIASMIDGVDPFMVEIISVARRLDEKNGRRLADTSVSVKYVITLPATSSVTTAKVKTAMTGTAAKSALKTGVNKELVEDGITYSVSGVEELSEPAQSAATGTAGNGTTGNGTAGSAGTASGAGSGTAGAASGAGAVSTSAVAIMGMIASQLTL